MLGFAMRAGKTVIGTELITGSLPRGNIKLVVISSSASEATKARLASKSKFYGVLSLEVEIAADELGRLLGKTYAPAAVALTDEGFATEIKKAYAEMKNED